jgi:phosphoribosylanthranilate isomerase
LIPHWILVGGVTSPQDARLAEALGADAISISMVPSDPRRVRLDSAAEIAHSVIIETVLELDSPDTETLRSAVLTVEPTRLMLRGSPPGGDAPPLPWFRDIPCKGREALTQLKDHPGDRVMLRLDAELLPGGRAWQRDRSLLPELSRMGAMVMGGAPSLEQLSELVDRARPWGLRLRSCVEREPGLLERETLERAMTMLRGTRR